jgi:hypothetical protein
MRAVKNMRMLSTHFCLDTKTGGAEKNQGLPEQPVSFFLDSPRLLISLYLQQHTYRCAFHRRLPLRGRQADFVIGFKPYNLAGTVDTSLPLSQA